MLEFIGEGAGRLSTKTLKIFGFTCLIEVLRNLDIAIVIIRNRIVANQDSLLLIFGTLSLSMFEGSVRVNIIVSSISNCKIVYGEKIKEISYVNWHYVEIARINIVYRAD